VRSGCKPLAAVEANQFQHLGRAGAAKKRALGKNLSPPATPRPAGDPHLQGVEGFWVLAVSVHYPAAWTKRY
jgi:hypothetical protein